MSGIYVLDTFALLAYLQDEAGSARVTELLRLASQQKARLLLTLINFGEAIYITERRRGLGGAMDIIRSVEELPVEQVEVRRELVFAAAHIKASNRLSYADAFAAALAMREKAILVTGDREFEPLVGLVQIEWLPQ